MKKNLILSALLLAAITLPGREILTNSRFSAVQPDGTPQDWSVAVRELIKDTSRKPEHPVQCRENSLEFDTGTKCEVVCSQVRIHPGLNAGKYRLTWQISGTPGGSFRVFIMYQINGKWQHTAPAYQPLPETPREYQEFFELPANIGNAYISIAVRGSVKARFSQLRLEPLEKKIKPADIAAIFNTAELFGKQQFVKAPASTSDTEDLESIIFDSRPHNGKPSKIFAYIGYPATPMPEGGYPALVLSHGGLGTAYAKYARFWMKRGYAVIVPDLYGKRPEGNKSVPMEGGIYILDQWVIRSAEALTRAHSILRSLPKVNKEKTGLIGISWGSVFSSVAAAVDHRFKAVAGVYGCGNWSSGNTSLIFTRWSNCTWDPKYFLPHIKTPFYMINGTNDVNFGVEPWNDSTLQIKSLSTRTLVVELPHNHDGFVNPGVIRFIDSTLKDGTPLPVLGKCETDKGMVRAKILSPGKGAVRASLLYTCSRDRKLHKRQWHEVPAKIGTDEVSARLPEGAVQFSLTLYDESGDRFAPAGSSNVVSLE